jgi:hypothetical protein
MDSVIDYQWKERNPLSSVYIRHDNADAFRPGLIEGPILEPAMDVKECLTVTSLIEDTTDIIMEYYGPFRGTISLMSGRSVIYEWIIDRIPFSAFTEQMIPLYVLQLSFITLTINTKNDTTDMVLMCDNYTFNPEYKKLIINSHPFEIPEYDCIVGNGMIRRRLQ